MSIIGAQEIPQRCEVEAGGNLLDVCNETLFSDEDSPYLPRPWEQSGVVRRDCDPDRGPLLLSLGCVSIAFGLLGCFLFVPAIPGAILGMLGYTMARADLVRMRAGTIDRNERKTTKEAEKLSAIGLALNLITCFACGSLSLFVFLSEY
jgi:hypothetical protein